MSVGMPNGIDLGLGLRKMYESGARLYNEDYVDADRRRQELTVLHILKRFTGDPSERTELQILADEVGMGKTMVALSVALALLQKLRTNPSSLPLDLRSAIGKVLIVTPPSAPLCTKWRQEAANFLERCSTQEKRDSWFRGLVVDRYEDMVEALCRQDKEAPTLVIFRMNRLAHHGKGYKYKQLYATLLERLLDIEGIPMYDRKAIWEMAALDAEPGEAPALPSDNELSAILERTRQATGGPLQTLGARVGDIHAWLAEMREGRYVDPIRFGTALRDAYQLLIYSRIPGPLPLVIVDEAHYWKGKRHNYGAFRSLVAPSTCRLLLLTATPFQLGRNELEPLLDLGSYLGLGPTRLTTINQAHFQLTQSLDKAKAASDRFAVAWGRLPARTTFPPSSQELRPVNEHLLAEAWTEYRQNPSAGGDVQEWGELAPFLKAARELHMAVQGGAGNLSAALSRFMIRHRRSREHRCNLAGDTVAQTVDPKAVPDIAPGKRPLLYAGQGLSPNPEDELALYLLMRGTHLTKKPQHLPELGIDLAGSYSALHDSALQRRLRGLKEAGRSNEHLELFWELYPQNRDAYHRKLATVTEWVLNRWERGEKCLIFCRRKPTAKALYGLIKARVEEAYQRRVKEHFSGQPVEKLIEQARRGTGSAIGAFLDPVLYGLCAVSGRRYPTRLLAEDWRAIAKRVAMVGGYDKAFPRSSKGVRPDRRLLHRILESALAERLRVPGSGLIRTEGWIRYPYGDYWNAFEDGDATASSDGAVRTIHGMGRAVYRPTSYPPLPLLDDELEELAHKLQHQHHSLFQSLLSGPNIFKGARGRLLLRQLEKLSKNPQGYNWKLRLQLVEAAARTLLSGANLVRTGSRRAKDKKLAEALVDAFYHKPKQGESVADRVRGFFTDLDNQGAGHRAEHMRHVVGRRRPVEMVTGDTQSTDQVGAFAGFNSPLLPEIMVCTKIGGEGIDLHRYCRSVIHYDLDFNPAAIEQRTGRIDRIGSLAFRERQLAGDGVFLNVGLPFMAGFYDEWVYEHIRIRSQEFEVLLGGEVVPEVPDRDDFADYDLIADGKETEKDRTRIGTVALSQELLDALRVQLAVNR